MQMCWAHVEHEGELLLDQLNRDFWALDKKDKLEIKKKDKLEEFQIFLHFSG